MQFLPPKSRRLLSLALVVAFFVPAYKGISGFRFVGLALTEVGQQTDLAAVDAFVVLMPLVLIPAVGAAMFYQALRRKKMQVIVLTLPLLFLVLFIGLLGLTNAGSQGVFRNPATFFRMQPGFYDALLCAALLPFTKNPDRRKRRRRRSSSPVTVSQSTTANASSSD